MYVNNITEGFDWSISSSGYRSWPMDVECGDVIYIDCCHYLSETKDFLTNHRQTVLSVGLRVMQSVAKNIVANLYAGNLSLFSFYLKLLLSFPHFFFLSLNCFNFLKLPFFLKYLIVFRVFTFFFFLLLPYSSIHRLSFLYVFY